MTVSRFRQRGLERFIRTVIASLALSTSVPFVQAQQPPSVDTAAVLAALAAVWDAKATSASRNSSDAWYVRPDDSVTLQFAAAIEQPTRPAPPRLVCRFAAPAGTVGASVTHLELRVRSLTTVSVSVAYSCSVPDTRGVFFTPITTR